jgi:sarcosine oxidase, subunit alpha
MGTIIDDGVIARLHEQHFYVTATSTGADAVYRKMLWWNAQWRMNVDVASVSAAFGAVNIAGPLSRTVLQTLCTADLSPEAFPYLAVRQAEVAGIPVRMMRVGFVGELGYELHAGAGEAEALWDALMEAGQGHGMRPFGVEAQRLLRLEKGHIIVAQDTDGLSTPEEIGAAWAVRDEKPFFVGQRALRIIRAQNPARRLVGFTLGQDAPMPEEGNLVLLDGAISGNVTSVGRSQAVQSVIGLALADVSQSAPGSLLDILMSSGSTARATVVKLPFYDPDGKRQQL